MKYYLKNFILSICYSKKKEITLLLKVYAGLLPLLYDIVVTAKKKKEFS